MARTWNEGRGGQCGSKPGAGKDFCRRHEKKQGSETWLGRVDGGVPEEKLKEFRKHATRPVREHALETGARGANRGSMDHARGGPSAAVSSVGSLGRAEAGGGVGGSAGSSGAGGSRKEDDGCSAADDSVWKEVLQAFVQSRRAEGGFFRNEDAVSGTITIHRDDVQRVRRAFAGSDGQLGEALRQVLDTVLLPGADAGSDGGSLVRERWGRQFRGMLHVRLSQGARVLGGSLLHRRRR